MHLVIAEPSRKENPYAEGSILGLTLLSQKDAMENSSRNSPKLHPITSGDQKLTRTGLKENQNSCNDHYKNSFVKTLIDLTYLRETKLRTADSSQTIELNQKQVEKFKIKTMILKWTICYKIKNSYNFQEAINLRPMNYLPPRLKLKTIQKRN